VCKWDVIKSAANLPPELDALTTSDAIILRTATARGAGTFKACVESLVA